MKRLALAVLAVLTFSLPASATVPRTISYQGVLTDSLGNPVPDGNYSLTLRLYDVATGGATVYTETHASVAVSRGGFNVLLGSVTTLGLTFDKPYWLSLQVNGNPELAPRVPLASSPYSMGLSLPFDGRANGPTPAFAVRNSSATALLVEGPVDILAPGGSTPIVDVQPFGLLGGQVTVRDEAGNTVFHVEPDADGTGGFLGVSRSATSSGFTVNGNDGTGEPIVTILGSARSSVFDMSQSGDGAVSLPSSVISASECQDEPGVAVVINTGSVTLSGPRESLISRTITPPENGYILAMAAYYAQANHVSGTNSEMQLGLSDDGILFGGAQDVNIRVPSTAASGTFRLPGHANGVFPAAGGVSMTIHLLGEVTTGSTLAVGDITLTLVFIPTAYGIVDEALAASGGGPGSDDSVMPAPTAADIAGERAASEDFDRARVQRELDEMRTRLEVIQERLGRDPNLTATAPGN